MDTDVLVMIYLLGSLIGLAILYAIIRVAVQAGVGAALRRHELWMRDGSLER